MFKWIRSLFHRYDNYCKSCKKGLEKNKGYSHHTVQPIRNLKGEEVIIGPDQTFMVLPEGEKLRHGDILIPQGRPMPRFARVVQKE